VKSAVSYLFSGCLITLLLTLPACSSTNQEETKPTNVTSPPSVTSETPATGEVDYSALGWTEDEIRMWEERGAASADSPEIASKIAGFPVVTPAFTPEGLQPVSKFMIHNHGAGLRNAGMEPKFEWIDVTLLYSTEGKERAPSITFIQSKHKFNVGLGEQVEICGHPAERQAIPADSENGIPEPGLAFGWESNGIWYYLTGTLTDTIDEAKLEKMLCSINTD